MNKFDKELIKFGSKAFLVISFIVFGFLYAISSPCKVISAETTVIERQDSIDECLPLTQDEIDAKRFIESHLAIEDDIKNEERSTVVYTINRYMDKIAPNNKIDADKLLTLCEKYSIDVIFVLAQAQIESHFGTCGTAAHTNSVFNVGAYDGHSAARQKRNGFGYTNPNDSIEPYLILLTNEYLVNGKTTDDLMNNFVNKYGMRYASNPQYERMLKNIYKRIYDFFPMEYCSYYFS